MPTDHDTPFCQTNVADRIINALGLAQRNNWIASIEGPPGIGKTRAALFFSEQNERRVWYHAARPDTAAKGPLFRDLAIKFAGFKYVQTRENVVALRAEASKRYLAEGPVLLIVDEAQYLNAETLETLRSLHDDGVLALALMGNHTFTDRFNAERQSLIASPQFLSRLDLTLRLSSIDYDDVAIVARANGIPDPLIRKLADIAEGLKGLRIIEAVSRLSRDFAGSNPPTRADFENALSVLRP